MLSADELAAYWAEWSARYPIISIEDGMAEEDWDGWKQAHRYWATKYSWSAMTCSLPTPGCCRKASTGVANSILIKVNQIGTITETIDAVQLAQTHGYTTVMSHRSGETEDTTIADLAVAINCGQIKTGSLSRTDRIAKYNQLLRIEEELGESAVLPRPATPSGSGDERPAA